MKAVDSSSLFTFPQPVGNVGENQKTGESGNGFQLALENSAIKGGNEVSLSEGKERARRAGSENSGKEKPLHNGHMVPEERCEEDGGYSQVEKVSAKAVGSEKTENFPGAVEDTTNTSFTAAILIEQLSLGPGAEEERTQSLANPVGLPGNPIDEGKITNSPPMAEPMVNSVAIADLSVEQLPMEQSLVEEMLNPYGVSGNPAETAGTLAPARAAEDMNNGTAILIVSMEQLLVSPDFSEEQVQKFADILGVSVDELMGIKISLSIGAGANPEEGVNPASGKIVQAVLTDGTEIEIARLLGIEKDGKLLSVKDVVEQISRVLGLNREQAEKMVKELRIFSLEIKGGGGDKNESLDVANKANRHKQSNRGIFLKKEAAERKVWNDQFKAEVKSEAHEESATVAKDGTYKNSVEESFQVTKDVPRTQVVEAVNTVSNSQRPDGTEIKFKAGKYANLETTTKILDQIVEKARILSFPKYTEARIVLNPPQLGSLEIKILVHDAQVKGQILVENLQVKQIVEQNLDQLKAAIAEHGISLDEMSIEIDQRQRRFGNDEDGHRFGKADFAGADGPANSDKEETAIEVEEMRRIARNSIIYVTA